MNDEAKSRKELMAELAELRLKLAERDLTMIEDELSWLWQAKGFYRDILESIVNGVWVTGPDDVVYYANRGMGQIAGILPEQICGVHALTGFSEQTLRAQ